MPAAAAAGKPGRIELTISPWGEVLVDGRSRGMSPPLQAVELAPGRHRIEIRNGEFPIHHLAVEVKAGQAATITHRFR
jgi:serine/threonine-protein kinase